MRGDGRSLECWRVGRAGRSIGASGGRTSFRCGLREGRGLERERMGESSSSLNPLKRTAPRVALSEAKAMGCGVAGVRNTARLVSANSVSDMVSRGQRCRLAVRSEGKRVRAKVREGSLRVVRTSGVGQRGSTHKVTQLSSESYGKLQGGHLQRETPVLAFLPPLFSAWAVESATDTTPWPHPANPLPQPVSQPRHQHSPPPCPDRPRPRHPSRRPPPSLRPPTRTAHPPQQQHPLRQLPPAVLLLLRLPPLPPLLLLAPHPLPPPLLLRRPLRLQLQPTSRTTGPSTSGGFLFPLHSASTRLARSLTRSPLSNSQRRALVSRPGQGASLACFLLPWPILPASHRKSAGACHPAGRPETRGSTLQFHP